MKRYLALILILSLLTALCGCGGTDAPAAAPEPTAESTPEPTAEPAYAPLLQEPFFVATMEMGRLYAIPLSGNTPYLLADKNTAAFSRCGDILWAAFDDGTVARIDLSSGAMETPDVTFASGLGKIMGFDGGFVGVVYSLADGPDYWLYRESTQRAEIILPGCYFDDFGVIGNELITLEYSDRWPCFIARDLDTMQESWRLKGDYYRSVCFQEDSVTVMPYDDPAIYRLNTQTHSLDVLPLTVSDTDLWLMYGWDGCFLVQGNYYDDSNFYLLQDGSRRQLSLDMGDSYARFVSGREEKALLMTSLYEESAAGDHAWYERDSYYIVDISSGTVEQIEPQGQYSALFAAGDFPVMDSSTARQPVTAQIYSFFCESTGAGGSVPLCSTTHGAWLNIADGAADIALLAAPTQEEQDYLDEQGVEVEMKLYGGDGLVFIGNKACGVTDLTLEQVRGIYRGEITNWAQLGGVDHPIRVLYRDDQSGSQRLFERMVWLDEPVPDQEALGFSRLDEMSTLVTQCLYDPYAIGYSIMTYLNDVYGKEDLLAFSLEGVDATPENVAAQSYPLSTRGYVVIRADEPEDSPARRLYNWFGSPLSDYILTGSGITPLHE